MWVFLLRHELGVEISPDVRGKTQEPGDLRAETGISSVTRDSPADTAMGDAYCVRYHMHREAPQGHGCLYFFA